jgi:hypothetical protein
MLWSPQAVNIMQVIAEALGEFVRLPTPSQGDAVVINLLSTTVAR